MSKRDFYEVLGVTRGCDDKSLKAAFRKLAMQYHPDRNNGDQTAEIKFKEVNAAYECLRDPTQPGVATLHFRWDGRRRTVVTT